MNLSCLYLMWCLLHPFFEYFWETKAIHCWLAYDDSAWYTRGMNWFTNMLIDNGIPRSRSNRNCWIDGWRRALLSGLMYISVSYISSTLLIVIWNLFRIRECKCSLTLRETALLIVTKWMKLIQRIFWFIRYVYGSFSIYSILFSYIVLYVGNFSLHKIISA